MGKRAGDPPAGFTLHAWVDESMKQQSGQMEGMYLLAAVVGDPATCEPARDALRELVRKQGGRLHWRQEEAPRRAKIAAAIGTQDLACIVVVGVPIAPRRQERARRKCMERLLFELERIGVSHVWLEARSTLLNRRDVELVDALRANGALVTRTRVEHSLPDDEPMLWAADAVAGAVARARQGLDLDIRTALGEVDEIDIELS